MTLVFRMLKTKKYKVSALREMKKLPIGLQTLGEIIRENYAYVDKTYFAHKLISRGKYYFLSRPRRFGKSLFLDTLSEIFKGNKELFKGLFIHDRYDFKAHPVMRISPLIKEYAEICGYTHEDLKTVFKEHLKGADLEMVKRWYNGYYYFGEKVGCL